MNVDKVCVGMDGWGGLLSSEYIRASFRSHSDALQQALAHMDELLA